MKKNPFIVAIVLWSFFAAAEIRAADAEAQLPAQTLPSENSIQLPPVSPGTIGSITKPGSISRENKMYLGHKVSLDFEDTSIKNVFRLLSEVSGVNIIAGEEIKGSVTVHIKSVPWDQALETILETNGLGQKRTGNVIAVFPLDKIKKAEEERLKTDIAQGRKSQIAIEAKIVETTSNFARTIGVQWGAGVKIGTNWIRGGGGLVPSGLTPYPGGIGVVTNPDTGFGESYLVNIANSYGASPSIGVLLGGSQAVLDAQLTALEGSGNGKIISSPKVTTLDNVKAYIKQGTAIPIITRGTTTEPPKVEYKDAVLQLTVTPTILPDGRLSLKILATNDAPDYATQTAQKLDNPPINKSEVESTVVVRDGETIVLGGIRKDTESSGEAAVPVLSKIPLLGWLFKSQSKTKDLREMLIFLTPKLIEDSLAQAGKQ